MLSGDMIIVKHFKSNICGIAIWSVLKNDKTFCCFTLFIGTNYS